MVRRRNLARGSLAHLKFLKESGVVYRLTLPPGMIVVRLMFHASMLLKYNDDKSHVLKLNPVQLDEKMTYEEDSSVFFFDRQV